MNNLNFGQTTRPTGFMTHLNSLQHGTKRKSTFGDINKKPLKVHHTECLPKSIHCIHGNKDHSLYRDIMISLAQKSIVITTYRLDLDEKEEQNLHDLFRSTFDKNVNVNIYYDHFSISPKRQKYTQDFLSQFDNIKLHRIDNHSKVLLVDGKDICIGSYDWIAKRDIIDENVSISLYGKHWKPLCSKFKNYLHAYELTSNTHQNNFSLPKASINFNFPYTHLLNDKSSLSVAHLLTTPIHHSEFIKETFDNSTKSIEIHSPFITTSCVSLKKRLDPTSIENHFKSNKNLTIVSIDKDRYLKCYLESRKECSNVNFITNKLMHQKIIAVDSETISIGSYNWLSAYLNFSEKNRKNLFDISLILKGDQAKRIITELQEASILQSMPI